MAISQEIFINAEKCAERRHDNAVHKWARLQQIVDAFFKEHGRNPTFWLDKVCIDQANIADGLRATTPPPLFLVTFWDPVEPFLGSHGEFRKVWEKRFGV